MEMVTIGNLLPYVLQVVSLAILATAIAALVRVDSAAVRYAYWRAVLGVSLALPLLQPIQRATSAGEMAANVSVGTATIAAGAARPLESASLPVDWTPVVLVLLGLGILGRLAWVSAGVYRLQRLRGLGRVVASEDVEVLQQTLGTRAKVRFVPALQQPATFGLVRPVVLVPELVRSQPPEIQRALLAHELIHVQRRDWFWVMCEELLLAMFWFNPATWWIVRQVRRAREEAVDELAILVTGSRRTYVKALLAFAGDAALAPAPAFAHRRHLFRRILLISTEAAMSSTRIVFSSAAMALVVVSGSWYAAGAFPLVGETSILQQGIGPVEQRAKPVNADNPVPKRIEYRAPEYPAEARAMGVSGMITLRIAVDELGMVAEARRVRLSLSATNPAVSFSLADGSPETLSAFVNKAVLRDKDGTVADNRTLARVADVMTAAAVNAIRDWRYQTPANGPVAFDVRVHFQADGETSAVQNTGMVGVPVASVISPHGAVRVGGNIKAPTKIKDVRPEYPPIAQQARVSGIVIVEVRVGVDGSVEDAQVLRSIPLLDQAALDAVRQWKFTPTLLNGAPTPVIMTMTVNFSLQ